MAYPRVGTEDSADINIYDEDHGQGRLLPHPDGGQEHSARSAKVHGRAGRRSRGDRERQGLTLDLPDELARP
jgi:hypothetical protein